MGHGGKAHVRSDSPDDIRAASVGGDTEIAHFAGREDRHMSFIWAIIAGLIIGLIAKALLPGKQDIPLWLTIILGVIGGVIGNAIATGLDVEDTNGIDWIRHILQIGAAAVLIGVVAPLWSKRSIR